MKLIAEKIESYSINNVDHRFKIQMRSITIKFLIKNKLYQVLNTYYK